jgi:transposase InsO family protein
LFGKSRQGYYKKRNHIEKAALDEQLVLSVVQKIRTKAKTKRWGVRKLKDMINKELNCIDYSIGRDRLFDLLRANHMLVRKRKRKYFTTDSHHWLRKYDNLIESKILNATNQLWVSDITYVKNKKDDVLYLYLITDAYSQKIVGWNISSNLKADSAIIALKMAIRDNKDKIEDLIHHSDRGVQYCSAKYVQLLTKNRIHISMTNPGSPQENAIAERINGILKEEWLYDLDLIDLPLALKKIKQIIKIYNTYRPHNSLKNKTPDDIHSGRFTRHETERVMSKMYKYKKRRPKQGVYT